MKKILVMAMIVGFFYLPMYVEQNYTMTGTVVNETLVRDSAGHEWEVDHVPYRDGETVKIHFHTNCTFSRMDDIVTKISLKK